MSIGLDDSCASFAAAVERWRTGPRVTRLFDAFDKLATGTAGAPAIAEVEADLSLFDGRTDLIAFYKRYRRYSGLFNAHFLASIPYVLEEEIRLGAAMTGYLRACGEAEGRTATLQTVGNAEAVIARTVVDAGRGTIVSLSNSPTAANEREFLRDRPEGSHFFVGPFFAVDPPAYARRHQVPELAAPFDLIYEDTAFQMYGPDREVQVPFILRHLRPDGVFVCLEKCRRDDMAEYTRREIEKDRHFKSRYFADAQIRQKGAILEEMQRGQVRLSDLVAVLRACLGHVTVTWNSGNFYTLAASRSRARLDAFTDRLGAPCIPPQFDNDGIGQRLSARNLRVAI